LEKAKPKPEPTPLKDGEVTMLDEMTDDAVLKAVQDGATTVREVRDAVGEDVGPLDVKASLQRLSDAGKVKREGAALTLVKAKAKTRTTDTGPINGPWPEGRTSGPWPSGETQGPARPAPKAEPVKVAAKVAQLAQPKPAPKAEPEGDGLDIPDFLRRDGDKPKPKAAKPAEKPAEKKSSVKTDFDEEGPPLHEHFVRGDQEATLRRILQQFADEKGFGDIEKIFPNIRDGITRKVSEKYDTMKAIAKEVPNFNTDYHTSQYVKALSVAGGENLRSFLQRQYPGHDDVFDRLLSDKVFAGMFSRKASKKDGTRK
jgi:hypothetical protein